LAVHDTRTITFDVNAFCDALVRCGRQAAKLGIRDAVDTTVQFDSKLQMVAIHCGAAHGNEVISVKGNDLVDLIVAYCSIIRVPLPALAQKKIKVVPDGIVMVMLHHIASVDGKHKTHPLAASGLARQWT
jgi:hypothetical protein